MNVAPDPRSGPKAGEENWHSFTCPVCGHRDRARVGAEGARTTCSHCETRLVLEGGTPEKERVSAAVDRSSSTTETTH